MQKKLFTLPLAFLAIAGCGGGSDIEAPYISGDSAFLCSQLTQSNALGDLRTEGAIVASAIKRMDIEYVDDTSVQLFYREFVRKQTEYATLHHRETLSSCSGDSEKSVNKASTEALNNLFARTKTEPRIAFCSSYNSGRFKVEDIVRSVVGSDLVALSLSFIYNDPEYGSEYLKKELDAHCQAKPEARLWNTLYQVASPAADKISAKAVAEQKAAQDKEREEAIARNLSSYSDSLYQTSTATCENFKKQTALATDSTDENKPTYFAGLQATISELPLPEEAYLREEFKSELKRDFEGTAWAIANRCSSDMTPETALLDTHLIQAAIRRNESTTESKDQPRDQSWDRAGPLRMDNY